MNISVDPGTVTGAAALWSGENLLGFILWELKGKEWKSGTARVQEVVRRLETATAQARLEVVICEQPIPIRGRNTAISQVLFRELKLWAEGRKARFVGYYPQEWRAGLGGYDRFVLKALWRALYHLGELDEHQVDAVGLGYYFNIMVGICEKLLEAHRAWVKPWPSGG